MNVADRELEHFLRQHLGHGADLQDIEKLAIAIAQELGIAVLFRPEG